MASTCPLLIRPAFIGRTYHDLQLNLESSFANCTDEFDQNPLLIQFTRALNTTLSNTFYTLFDLAKPSDNPPVFHVRSNDHFNVCVRSALSTGQQDASCHEFYTFPMLSTRDTTLWPLLIIFGYLLILLLAMLSSLFAQAFDRLSQTLISGSITKKLVKNRNFRSFLPLSQRHEQTQQLKKLDEKKTFLRTLDLIARECRSPTTPFIISTENECGQINRTYF